MKAIGSATLLMYYDPQKPVTNQTNNSLVVFGWTLVLVNVPAAFVSKELTQSRKIMYKLKKEMLAIVFAWNRFDQYTWQMGYIIETDHSSLVSIIKRILLKSPNRLQSMILSPQKWNVLIKYNSGNELFLAHALQSDFRLICLWLAWL